MSEALRLQCLQLAQQEVSEGRVAHDNLFKRTEELVAFVKQEDAAPADEDYPRLRPRPLTIPTTDDG